MNTFNHGWGMGFGWLIPLLIIAVIFYALQNNKKEKSSAQDILDKRYASGGISKEEYEEKSRLLREKELKG
ncbi:MAG: hypothetical protein L3J43_03245 [Sulfurovum sp.]|nr:hypothetical protein [Sulfurovum sp.]